LIYIINKTLESKSFIEKHRASSSCFIRSATLNFKNIMLMIMGNLRGSYQSELHRYFDKVSGLGQAPTSGAFCLARKKVLSNAFSDLHHRIVDEIYQNPEIKRLEQFRVLAVDGSTVRLNGVNADCKKYFRGLKDPEQESDGVQLARVSYCYDVLNKFCVDAQILPDDVGEVTAAHLHLQSCKDRDLVLLDRNYGGFRLCNHLAQKGAHFCVRLKINQCTKLIGDFLRTKERSRIVQWDPCTQHIGQCEDLGFEAKPMKVRLVKILLKTGEIEVLLTSLLDEQRFSVDWMSALYSMRWQVEEAFKFIKSQMQIERWSGKSQCAVEQDFFGRVILGTLSAAMSIDPQRMIDQENAKRINQYQVNQTLAMRNLRDQWAQLMNTSIRTTYSMLVEMFPMFLRDQCRVRSGRSYPRNFKMCRRDFAFSYKAVA
jgi:hypothetical protein